VTYSETFQQMVESANKPRTKEIQVEAISDTVLDIYNPFEGFKLLGHVGFHEIDAKYNVLPIIERAVEELNTVIAVLDTTNGYHFVSFEILNVDRWWQWKWWMRKNFDESHYTDGICDDDLLQMNIVVKDDLYKWECPKCHRDSDYKDRLLRIGTKGDEPPPKVIYWRHPKNDRTFELSDRHVLIYQEKGIIGNLPIKYKLIHTRTLNFPYSTKVVAK